MLEIPIAAVPRQQFTLQIAPNYYGLNIVIANNIMAVSLSRNDEIIVTGFRVVAGTLVLPYEYQEQLSGNFLFTTADGEYPDYTQFGISQKLIFITNDELELYRASA